jgi:hypothetical protein
MVTPGQMNTKPLCSLWIHTPAFFSRLALQVVGIIPVEVGGHDAFLLKDFLSFGDHSFLALERFELIEYVS